MTACESKVTRNVAPSGALLATCIAPSEPAAPDLFSTSTVRPSLVCRCDCNSRASASVEPPGGNGTTSVMFLAGCASAGVTANAADAASRLRLVIFTKCLLPIVAALFCFCSQTCLKCRILSAEAGPGLFVFGPRRAEDVKHARPLRSSPHPLLHISRRAPEIALLDRNFLAALNPDGRAIEQHSPLFLGVMMQGALRVRRQRHHRQHRVLAGENSRRDPGREFAQQAIMRIVEIVKFVLLTHRFSLTFFLGAFTHRSRLIRQDLSIKTCRSCPGSGLRGSR